MRCGFDVDGVIYNFPEALRRYMCEFKGRCRPDLGNPLTWDFFTNEWGMGKQEYLDIYNSEPEFLFSQGGGINFDKLEVLRRLRADGHQLIFVTSRYIATGDSSIDAERFTRAYKATWEWFRRQEIPYDELHVVSAGEKGALASRLDFYLDDYWKNLDEMKAENPALHTCLYERPYNEDFRKNHLSIERFSECYNLIRNIFGTVGELQPQI